MRKIKITSECSRYSRNILGFVWKNLREEIFNKYEIKQKSYYAALVRPNGLMMLTEHKTSSNIAIFFIIAHQYLTEFATWPRILERR